MMSVRGCINFAFAVEKAPAKHRRRARSKTPGASIKPVMVGGKREIERA